MYLFVPAADDQTEIRAYRRRAGSRTSRTSRSSWSPPMAMRWPNVKHERGALAVWRP